MRFITVWDQEAATVPEAPAVTTTVMPDVTANANMTTVDDETTTEENDDDTTTTPIAA